MQANSARIGIAVLLKLKACFPILSRTRTVVEALNSSLAARYAKTMVRFLSTMILLLTWALTKEEMKGCVWLRPQLVAQIEFTEWTPDGHLRHSKFVALRQDKDPKDVLREIAGRKVVNSTSH